MIEGVVLHRLERHIDERGSLMEVLRSDWPGYTAFGQAILTMNLPGVIRAWHWHRRQCDAIVVIQGRALLPLYDRRPGSRSVGTLDEHVADSNDPFVLFVPPGVLHGYKTLGDRPALILNLPDQIYDPRAPDEERIPYDSPEIGFDWSARS